MSLKTEVTAYTMNTFNQMIKRRERKLIFREKKYKVIRKGMTKRKV